MSSCETCPSRGAAGLGRLRGLDRLVDCGGVAFGDACCGESAFDDDEHARVTTPRDTITLNGLWALRKYVNDRRLRGLDQLVDCDSVVFGDTCCGESTFNDDEHARVTTPRDTININGLCALSKYVHGSPPTADPYRIKPMDASRSNSVHFRFTSNHLKQLQYGPK